MKSEAGEEADLGLSPLNEAPLVDRALKGLPLERVLVKDQGKEDAPKRKDVCWFTGVDLAC